jgi:hypothetical protein
MHFAENTYHSALANGRGAMSFGFLTLAVCAATAGLTQAATEHSGGGSHRVTLGWKAVPETGVRGYNVYLKAEDGTQRQVAKEVVDTRCAIDGLEYGKTYQLSVRAVADSGVEGVPSEPFTLTVAKPPLPHGGKIEISARSQGPGLKWYFPKSAMGTAPEFFVEESADMVTWKRVGTVDGSQAVAEDGERLEFEWPVHAEGPQKFYRLSAANWLGAATEN